jgi:2-keto-4-pentenoate hydratase
VRDAQAGVATADRMNGAADLRAAERAEWLLGEHRARRPFRPFADALALSDLDAAYAVQAVFVEGLAAARGTARAGYKIGLTSARIQAMCGIPNPIAGVVLADRVAASGARLARETYGRLGVEFEIAVRLGRDLPAAGAPYSGKEIATAVAAVCPAIEVIDDRGADYAGLDMLSLVADNAWNAGLVLGPWQTAWPDLATVAGVARCDGQLLDRGSGADVLDHPYNALTWLANHLAGQGMGLACGDVVATGSLITTRFPTGAASYEFALDALGAVSVTVR